MIENSYRTISHVEFNSQKDSTFNQNKADSQAVNLPYSLKVWRVTRNALSLVPGENGKLIAQGSKFHV